jgi:hypothetical protein
MYFLEHTISYVRAAHVKAKLRCLSRGLWQVWRNLKGDAQIFRDTFIIRYNTRTKHHYHAGRERIP